MDKAIEIFCKQNPNINFECGDSNCKTEHSFKTKDVFKNAKFTFVCTKCEQTTNIDTVNFVKSFKEKLKKLGVKY